MPGDLQGKANNTAPHGTRTKALQGLTTLADELAENSGINTSIPGWLESWFAKRKGMIVSLFTSLVVVAGTLMAITCCVRGLGQQLIKTALLKQTPVEPPPYSDKMMVLEEMGSEEREEEEDVHEKLYHRKKLQKSTMHKEEKRDKLWELWEWNVVSALDIEKGELS